MIRYVNLARKEPPPPPPPVNEMAVELAFWKSINQKAAPELRVYLERFPDGHFSAIAKLRIATLEAEAATTTTLARIIQLVSEKSGISPLGLISPRRARKYAYPRFVAMELARQFTGCTMPQIAKEFGRKDHTTVLHGLKTIADMKLCKHPSQDMKNALALLETCCEALQIQEGK